MSNLEPQNRRLYVLPEASRPGLEEQAPLILLPEDFKSSKEVLSEFAIAEVVKSSLDCTSEYFPGTKVVFPTHLLETVSIRGQDYAFILENHIIASWTE